MEVLGAQDHGGDSVGDQECLGDDEGGCEQSESGRDDDVDPRRSGVSEQTRVEGFHPPHCASCGTEVHGQRGVGRRSPRCVTGGGTGGRQAGRRGRGAGRGSGQVTRARREGRSCDGGATRASTQRGRGERERDEGAAGAGTRRGRCARPRARTRADLVPRTERTSSRELSGLRGGKAVGPFPGGKGPTGVAGGAGRISRPGSSNRVGSSRAAGPRWCRRPRWRRGGGTPSRTRSCRPGRWAPGTVPRST